MVNDRYYCSVTRSYFTLWLKTESGWGIEWSDTKTTGLIYFDEISNLELFGSKLIKIESDKHLLELNLRYG